MNELNGYYRTSISWDREALAPRLRLMDQMTIKWMTDMTPLEGLEYTQNASPECNTILVNDQVEGMFGIAGSSEEACPWLLMSDFLNQHPRLHRKFLVESRRWIETQVWRYNKLFNFVYKEHQEHIRWLEWLGFEIKDLYPKFGPYQKPFLYFEMRGMI